MQTSQDMLTAMQTQALEAIRTGQAATLELSLIHIPDPTRPY